MLGSYDSTLGHAGGKEYGAAEVIIGAKTGSAVAVSHGVRAA
jgi:hypothetical protein